MRVAESCVLFARVLWTDFGPIGAKQYGTPKPRTMAQLGAQLDSIQAAVKDSERIVLGLGLQESPGHVNASCGITCADVDDPKCSCCNYGWDEPSLKAWLRLVSAKGLTKVTVYRQDMTPPVGTTSDPPAWFIGALAEWLHGGGG